jgi:spore maturation protein CgeB
MEVKQFTAPVKFKAYYNNSLWNKLLFRAGLSPVYGKINSDLKALVDTWQPDIVWIFKGMEILPDTLKWMAKKGVKLTNYNPDNPFIFTGKGSGNSNITRSINLYDFHFTYNLDIREQLGKLTGKPVYYLPFGYELSDSLFSECGRQEEVIKTCFVGNPDIKRAKFIASLAEKGVSLDVYGNHWPEFVKHHNVTIYQEVRNEEFWKTLRRYRIQLNLTRIHSEDSHNMRTFEVPGVGGIMLAKDTTEHRSFFEDGREVFLFDNVDDCVEIIKRLLTMPNGEASCIRVAAVKRSEDCGYNYKERAKKVYQAIIENCK